MDFFLMVKKMAGGLGATTSIFLLTILFSMPLGMLLCAVRRSKMKVPQWIARVYISIMRGTPLMLQLIAINYAPSLLLGLRGARNKLVPIVLSFSLNYAAYLAEIFRGGIDSIPVGQYEAATVLGYNRWQTFIHIVLPQVIKRVLPSITNEAVTLVKDTSIAFAIGYQEMFTIGKSIANSQASFMPFVIAGVFYFIFNAIVSALMNLFEHKLSYYR